MLSEPVLIDTGAFAALFDPTDQHHAACTAQFQDLPVGKSYTCWPVVTETAYLIRRYARQRNEFLNAVAIGDFPLLVLNESDLAGIQRVMDKYRDQDIDFADATIVHLADRENIGTIFTLDRRHFTIFRQADGAPFTLLPRHE